ncbi:TrmB family transcriptional regulator [Orenia marismortui]|uniref:TrmB family transcriptional regulator n=1 Tax=Orenia marismortui TaxID=46469 RepID=UPI0010646F89|nr:TrmB family transcriptional regulator [Orenia marismortui]
MQKFNFTEIEARVYVELIKSPNCNGSQIAKELNLPRTSVYSALDKLYQQGAIFLLPNRTTKVYVARAPKELLKNLKEEMLEAIDYLDIEFQKIDLKEENNNYLNIQGKDNFIEEAKKMLLSAEEEVYINTDYDLSLFKSEFKFLEDKGVRVVLFSFTMLNLDGLDVEFYHHQGEVDCCSGKRLMLVIDQNQVLIGNEDNNGEVLGTFTKNSLMVSIIAEHIHHDIYLLKLKDKYGRDLIDEGVKLNSLFELNSKICT